MAIDIAASGLIDANVSGETMTFNANATGATNGGVMRASGGGTLNIIESAIDNSGGSIQALVGSTVKLTGGTTVTGGTLSGAGTFSVPNSGSAYLTDLTHSGTTSVGQFATFGIAGTIANTGAITIDGSGSSSIMQVQAGGATLSGGGTITLGGNAASLTGLVGTALTIADQTIQGVWRGR